MLLQRVLGWLALSGSAAFTCTWAVWGILENFHEGFYHRTLARNLAMMLVQYLSPMLVFLAAGVAGVQHPWGGLVAHLLLAAAVAWRFRTSAGLLFIALPLVGLGLLYLFGRPEPRRLALLLLAVPPLLLTLGLAVEPAWRVAHRLDDGQRGARRIEGHGVALLWAPAGPGWPDHGMSWHEARLRCAHLSEDGLRLEDAPQGLWRLPTLDESVRSLVRGGRHCEGSLDPTTGQARFARRPDKESPLWDPHSKIIYWWTASEAGPERAYRIAYNGHVMALPKSGAWGYLGFRCVRDERR